MKTIKTLLLSTVLITAPLSLATASPKDEKSENDKIERADEEGKGWIALGQVTGRSIDGETFNTGMLYLAIIQNTVFYKIRKNHQDYMVQHATKENTYDGCNAFFSLGSNSYYFNVPYWGAPEEEKDIQDQPK